MNGYRIRTLDLDTRFEYLVIYKDKRDNTISTSTVGVGFPSNYKVMIKDSNIKILAVYRKMKDEELEELL